MTLARAGCARDHTGSRDYRVGQAKGAGEPTPTRPRVVIRLRVYCGASSLDCWPATFRVVTEPE